MKIVRNRFIPFPGFKYVNLFGVLFTRDESGITGTELNHESIHTMQMKEMLYVFFYLWYVAEWLVRLLMYRDRMKAYRNISFEREAYGCQYIHAYGTMRRHFAWLGWLRSKR